MPDMTPLGFLNRALSSANEACCQTPNEGALVESAAMGGRFWTSQSRDPARRGCVRTDAITEDRTRKAVASAVPVRIERP